MRYLRLRDYAPKIQTQQLYQLYTYPVNGANFVDQGIRLLTEDRAVAEAISYLKQRFETSLEFKSIQVYDINVSYDVTDVVYLDAPAWSAATTYDPADLIPFVTYQLTAGATPSIFISIANGVNQVPYIGSPYWQLVGYQNQEYYASYPYDLFDLKTLYKQGDKTFWKGKVYTCLAETANIFQNKSYNASTLVSPTTYIFPDTPEKSTPYWDNGVSYVVPAGTLPSDTLYWTLGDNRDPQLVGYCVDIALYYLHQRISPNNIPAIRIADYRNAIEWLNMAKDGQVVTTLPLLQPDQGKRLMIGSGNFKNINTY